MNITAWHEEPIGKRHDREAFDCGETALNGFLQRYARPASIAYSRTPELVRRGLAHHDAPAFRLARLAVDLKVQGQGLGKWGGVAMLIDAKNAGVAAWYASYGALPLLDVPLSLLLPLTTVAAALKAARR